MWVLAIFFNVIWPFRYAVLIHACKSCLYCICKKNVFSSKYMTNLNIKETTIMIRRFRTDRSGQTNRPTQLQRLVFINRSEILDLASIGIILTRQRTSKALISLRGCAG